MQVSVADAEHIPCPKCHFGRILFYLKVAKCSNVDCSLTVFRNKGEKQLTDSQIADLVTKGQDCPNQRIQKQGGQDLRCVPHFRQEIPHRVRVPAPNGQTQRKGAQVMNGSNWITVTETILFNLLVYLKKYRLSRLYSVRNFGSQPGMEILR